MASELYLAMTAAEFSGCDTLPPKLCWMACHFSPYGTGLSNIPRELPTGSILILNDRTPIHGHNPTVIANQLSSAVEDLSCRGVLLDFQRRKNEETAAVIGAVLDALPCPVAVSDCYAKDFSCPVFLPPVPPHVPLVEHLTPWEGRDIWLELALDEEIITLTESGADIATLPSWEVISDGHWDEALHCHYHIDVSDEDARFTLWRTKEDIHAILTEAESCGISFTVGLYQELS